MFKRILLLTALLFLIGSASSIIAQDRGNPGPSIFLQPTNIDAGNLITPEPVEYNITINNFGKSLLYISKIKYT